MLPRMTPIAKDFEIVRRMIAFVPVFVVDAKACFGVTGPTLMASPARLLDQFFPLPPVEAVWIIGIAHSGRLLGPPLLRPVRRNPRRHLRTLARRNVAGRLRNPLALAAHFFPMFRRPCVRGAVSTCPAELGRCHFRIAARGAWVLSSWHGVVIAHRPTSRKT